MVHLRLLACSAAFCLLLTFPSKRADADLIVPGDDTPLIRGELFTWTMGQAGSTNAVWSDFGPPGFLPAGSSIAANTGSPDPVAPTASTLTLNNAQGVITGGRLYSFFFGNPAPVQPQTFLDATATIRPNNGAAFLRVVMQWSKGGSAFDTSSVQLTPQGATTGVSPDLLISDNGQTSGGGFGGSDIDYLAVWDLDNVASEYSVDFGSAGNHMVLDGVRLDTFAQSTAFATVTAVPEPSLLAILSVAGCAGVIRRKRLTKSSARP